MSHDIIFHLLDIQAHDMRIESEHDDFREIAYEHNGEQSEDDDEIKHRHLPKKQTYGNNFQKREFVIHLFGATDTGQSVRCDVTGFRPTLYLRLPEDKTTAAIESIKEYIASHGIQIRDLHIKRIMKKVFYGFTANTFYPFLQIDVPSLYLFRKLRSLFLDDSLNPHTSRPLNGVMHNKTIEVYEANIDPMLRFIHTQNIQPCGWILIKDGQSSISQEFLENPSSLIVIECDYEQVTATKGPRVSAPFLTASWDIECFSMTGDFPLAKRTWKKTAKDLVHLAKNNLETADLILKSLSVGHNPADTLPKGMTPIYCQLRKPLDDISKKLLEPHIQETIGSILKSKDYDEKVERLEKLLEVNLKKMIYLVGDPVIQIGTTLTRGTPDTTERHVFVFPDCADIPGITIHAYKTEKAMILAWFEWMIKRNPDILIGYNVFGFDESYVWHRCEELGIITPTSIVHQMTRLFTLSGEVKLEDKFLSSSAMGDNLMYIWTTHGRLQIDLFHYIKRNNVLPSYKLDEVTKHFMSGKLKGQQYYPDTHTLVLDVAGAVKDVKVGRAIALLDDTGETVSDKLVVESIDGAKITFKCELDNDALREMEDATKWVIVKDDVSPQDIFRLHRESAAGRAIVAKYCSQDCELVLDLYKKLETFNNTMCMANVCSVPVSYIFTRGQGIKIESLIFKYCRERDILIPVLPTPKGDIEDTYEGAIVLNPEPGFYSDSPIGVCDFASLYPSTIVSENISHDSLLWIKDFNADGTLISHNWGSELYDNCDGYAYTDIEFDIWRPDPADTRKHPRKIRCGRRICRYAQPLDGTKSTLPQITSWLLSAREAKKKEMKGEKDPERYALLDAEQLAYKLTGNSLYGQLGSGTFKIRLQALAASVTAYGRKQILFAKAAIEQFYGPGKRVDSSAKVVYGDTDSLFVAFNVKNSDGILLKGREARQATIDITDEAGHFITKALKPPHDFEFDKAFDPMLMFSKKRYAGNMYENNADDYVHKYMGIALKRRDNAPIVKTIFGGAMKMLLDKRDVDGAFRFVKDKCMELVEGKVSLGQLTVTKSLRADYSDPSRIAHKALADRITSRDPGNAPAAGDRIGYVYISPKSGQEASKLQGERIETPLFVKEHGLIPDYRHYIEHQLQNPISQAFGLLLEKIPGFRTEMLAKCPKKPDMTDWSEEAERQLDAWLGFREMKAAELLFSDCLKTFETSSRRSAIMSMFGGAVSITNTAPRARRTATDSMTTTAPAGAGAGVSSLNTKVEERTMSNYILDSMIIDSINKKERSRKQKEKGKGLEKEKKSKKT